MEIFILLNALLLTGAAAIPGGYIEAGLSYHPAEDLPEIQLDHAIASWEFGYQRGKHKFYYSHDSGIATVESGLGFNKLGYKYKFK